MNHRTAIALCVLIGMVLGCARDTPTATEQALVPPVPPLESVPYSLLGPGHVAFQRIFADSFVGFYSTNYVIDATAMSSAHVFDHSLAEGPALSPDGRRLAFTNWTDFSSADYLAGAEKLRDVYVLNLDGTGWEDVTRLPGLEGPPTWTPDGTKIVVTGEADPPRPSFVIYTQSPVPNPGDLTEVTLGVEDGGSCPYLDHLNIVVASTQGLLAYACQRLEIDVLASDGTPSARYPSRSKLEPYPEFYAPSWSPDGTRLAFIEANPDSATNYLDLAVRAMDADGGNVTTIVTVVTSVNLFRSWGSPNNVSLCWMPDGSRLVFNVPESFEAGHIWVVQKDGTGLAQLTSAPGVWDQSVSCSR